VLGLGVGIGSIEDGFRCIRRQGRDDILGFPFILYSVCLCFCFCSMKVVWVVKWDREIDIAFTFELREIFWWE